MATISGPDNFIIAFLGSPVMRVTPSVFSPKFSPDDFPSDPTGDEELLSFIYLSLTPKTRFFEFLLISWENKNYG